MITKLRFKVKNKQLRICINTIT